MSRRLLVINVALGIVSLALAVIVVRTLLAKRPLPPPPPPRAASAPAPAVAPRPVNGGPGAYAVIAARSLFNPDRSETAPVAAAAPVAKPILHGVVMNGAKSRAFLEDPTLKRVAGYSVGDTVGGGTIEKIADDRVVIARPGGNFEVLLQDPSKPRPAPLPVATPGQAAPGQVAPGQVAPGQIAPGQVFHGQAAPGQVAPGQVGTGRFLPGQAGPGRIPAVRVGPGQVAPGPAGQPSNDPSSGTRGQPNQ